MAGTPCKTKGAPQKQQLIIEKASANVDAADALFAFPTAGH